MAPFESTVRTVSQLFFNIFKGLFIICPRLTTLLITFSRQVGAMCNFAEDFQNPIKPIPLRDHGKFTGYIMSAGEIKYIINFVSIFLDCVFRFVSLCDGSTTRPIYRTNSNFKTRTRSKF